MNTFAGKKVLVTGAAGGICAAIVRDMRARGARVAVADRDTTSIRQGLTRTVTTDHSAQHFSSNSATASWINTGPDMEILKAQPDSGAFGIGIGKVHPIDCPGQTEEVSALVAWLASPEASFVTGQVWTIDGGRMSQLSLPQ